MSGLGAAGAGVPTLSLTHGGPGELSWGLQLPQAWGPVAGSHMCTRVHPLGCAPLARSLLTRASPYLCLRGVWLGDD